MIALDDILLDVGFIGIGRLILLDSMLIFFTTATTYYYTLFRNQGEKHSFSSRKWWTALFMTGVCIGCVSSVKWVGFFVTALVGLMTIEELWGMLGNVHIPKVSQYTRHTNSHTLSLFSYELCNTFLLEHCA